MPRRWRTALLALAAVVAACLPYTAAVAAHHRKQAAATSATDNFWIHCGYTGITATIDPIVDPGSVATAHFHDFYGNTTIDQNSTPDSLRAAGVGATTCSTATDTAGYWAPTLVLGPGETQTYGPAGYPCAVDAAGLQACHYSNVRAYYSTGGSTRSLIHVPPAGMEAVGGSHDATGPQSTSEIGWSCGGSTPFEQFPYDCTGYINTSGNNDQDGAILRVVFPRCWDGTGTAPSDFAYPTNGTAISSCPAGFPDGLPLINVRFHTGIVTPCPGQSCPAGSAVTPDFGFELADGTMMPWYQAHGDFMNGWSSGDGGLDDLVQDCLISALPCPVNPHTSPTSNMPT